MPRSWISIPIGFGIRVGRSIADSELHPRLPSWRRFELRRGMQADAEARGEHMTREEADYGIDKAIAEGEIDADGNPREAPASKRPSTTLIIGAVFALLVLLLLMR